MIILNKPQLIIIGLEYTIKLNCLNLKKVDS